MKEYGTGFNVLTGS